MSVIAVCQLKSGGSSTLALTLASAAAAAGRTVTIVEASRNGDLARWANLPGCPRAITVAHCHSILDMERATREALLRGSTVIVDPGTKEDRLRMAARSADIALVPVRFSPLSAYWAAQTERLLRAERELGRPRRHAFVATAISQIPSRIARAMEASLDLSEAERLPAGLALRAAFEAPFQFGGTIFTLGLDTAPGLSRAREDASAVASALGAFARAPAPIVPVERESDLPSWRGLRLADFMSAGRMDPVQTGILQSA